MYTYEYPILFNRTLIFDGSYALHRSLALPEKFDMRTTTGIGTGGIFGTLMTIQKEMKTFNYFPIVVFDGGLSKRRLEIFPNYKRNLEKQQLNECWENRTEEQIAQEQFMAEYRAQRNILVELLPLLGIPCIRLEGWEGDDLLYVISKMSEDSIIVSDDKDIIQLIADPILGNNNRVCKIRRALNNEMWDANTLKQMNQTVQDFIGCKAIVGDSSDNLVSACDGVGPKTAPALLKLIENTHNKGLYYPNNEKDLDVICKQLDIPKRKAYLNLNMDQFISNYLMTDLKFVDSEITKDVINTITDKISETLLIQDINSDQYKNLEELLNKLEINSFKPLNTINRLLELKDMLYIQDKPKVQDISKTMDYSNNLF